MIREALRILEISGLINIKKGPSGGIFVSKGYDKPIKNSLKNMMGSGEFTLDHLFDVRLLIEPFIAMEAAEKASEKDLKAMANLFRDSELHPDDPVYLKKNNLQFHLLVAKASGNPILTILLKCLFEILNDTFLDQLDINYERSSVEDHKNILKVISERNPEKARQLIKKDIENVRVYLKKMNK